MITEAEVEGLKADFEAFLDAEFEAGKTYQANKADWLDGKWSGMSRRDGSDQRGETAVDRSAKKLGAALTRLPDSGRPHKTVERVIDGQARR